MKKYFLVILSFLFCTQNLCAELKDSVLTDCYGAIRADMIRTVCHIVGFKNDSVLKSISNSSLKTFKDSITSHDTLFTVVNCAKTLNGTDVLTYSKNLKETRRNLQYQLSVFFPEKEIEIENSFHKYIQQIDELTKECNAFNKDTTSTLELYAKEYPFGRFSKNATSTENVDITTTSITECNDTTKIKSATDNNEPNMVQGIFYIIKGLLITFIKLCIGLILTIILLVIAIKKRKKIVSIIKTIYFMIIHKNVPVDTNDLQTQEKMDTDSPVAPDTPTIIEVDTDKENDGKSTEVPEKENDTPTKNPEPPTEPQPQPKKSIDPKGKSTAFDADEWIVVGASVQGNGHISMDLPCQDSHMYEYIRDGWGIAITSDGAGSAKLSHIGSAASAARAMIHFKELIEKEKWIEKRILPSDIEWMKMSYQVLKTVKNELELLANNNKCDIKDLSATIIVVIHSPIGLLSVHIGDGRAGYKDMNGEWHSLITPHKGEEANQTIFIPSDFWNIQFYEMSGVSVPESRVVREQVSAFVLMSDGCESTSWLWNQYNETTGKYYDPNLPHRIFFESLIKTLQLFRKEKTPLEERREKWYKFIKEGNKSFVKETDDKTMILGALYM